MEMKLLNPTTNIPHCYLDQDSLLFLATILSKAEQQHRSIHIGKSSTVPHHFLQSRKTKWMNLGKPDNQEVATIYLLLLSWRYAPFGAYVRSTPKNIALKKLKRSPIWKQLGQKNGVTPLLIANSLNLRENGSHVGRRTAAFEHRNSNDGHDNAEPSPSRHEFSQHAFQQWNYNNLSIFIIKNGIFCNFDNFFNYIKSSYLRRVYVIY